MSDCSKAVPLALPASASVLRLVAYSLLLVAGASHAIAQDQGLATTSLIPAAQPGEAAVLAAKPGPSARATLRAQHAFSADLEDVAGDVSISRFAGQVGLTFPTSDRSQIGVSLFSETSLYDFSEDTAFAPSVGAPWEDVQELGLGVTFRDRISETWSYFVGAGIDANYEFGADVGESLTYAGLGGARYEVSPELGLGLGAIVSSRLEEDVFFIAFPTIDWRPSKDWRLATGPGDGRAVELRLSYIASEEFTASLFGAFEARGFRLDEDGPVPDGVGRDWRVPVGVGLAWTPHPQVQLSLEGGAFVYSELTLDDSNGDEISQVEPDIAPFILGEIRFSF